MRFLHLTDIHFLRTYPVVEEGYLSIFKEMTPPLEQLKKGLANIRLEDVDAVLITGDLTEYGTAEDYKALRQALEGLFGHIPLVVTLGNHDDREAFYEGWLEQQGNAMPYHTVTILGNTTIIGLDISDKIDQNGVLGEAHCRWLEEALAEAKGTDILLMMHHHLLPTQATIPPVAYKDTFESIIEQSDIKAILCGHTHHTYTGTFAGKPYYTAANLSFSGVDEGEGVVRFESNSAFNDCNLQNGRLEVRAVGAEQDKRLLTKVKFR
ncbi:MAG: metallophosphoesterase family protein [Cellulosilyticaceae bacterium]